ncbi:MAG: phosphoribosylamine--glycine ligase [Candidatus Cloacimonetes bacterium]|nr:phosphoribosylamine--glycine ligase [Candidatus Cloacimonadota bacterium]
MKVMIVGSGGREHAIAESIAKSNRVNKVYVTPGNPGMSSVAKQISSQDFKDIYNNVLDKHIDLVIIGPEQPLQEGIVDYLEDKGVMVIGPSKEAAKLETSKVFAKSLMQRYNIPTAEYRAFSDYDQATKYLEQISYPTVIKADGLAAGKGVYIAENEDNAFAAVQKLMLAKDFGRAGEQIVIEEFLNGFEASIFAFTDSRNYKSTILSHDYKKIYDGDKGPNTGGMGAYAPVKISKEQLDTIDNTIFNPLLSALKKECIEYKGVIYAGLIFTSKGIKVLEFNCRLGDPETQAVLPLMKTDLVDICEAIAYNRVEHLDLEWEKRSAVSIVAASEGYPGKCESSKLIAIDDSIGDDNSLRIFFSNVDMGVNEQSSNLENVGMRDRVLYSSGGRVLTLTALASTIQEARTKAYNSIEKIKFDNIYYRRDIGLLNNQ